MKKSALEMTEIVKKEIIFYLLGFCLTRLVPLRVKILLNDTYPRKYVNYRQTNTKEMLCEELRSSEPKSGGRPGLLCALGGQTELS